MSNLFKATTIGGFAGASLYVPAHVTEVTDPLGQLGTVIKCELHKEDTNLAPPSEDARIQLSSTFIIPKNGETWLLSRFMVPTLGNGGPPAVTNAEGGFLQIHQVFAPPFEGVAPFAIKLEDWNAEGTNWLQFRRNSKYTFDAPWRRKVITGHWYTLKVKMKLASAGWVEMWLDGEQITFWKEGETGTPANPDVTKLEYETLQAGVNDEGEGKNAFMSTVYRKKGTWEPFSIYYDINSIATTEADLEPVEEAKPGTIEKKFGFDGATQSAKRDEERWAPNNGGATGIGLYDNASGTDSPNDPNAEGHMLAIEREGENKTNGAPYWEWTGKYEQMGLPANATITAINLNYDYRCDTYATGAASTVGPAEFRDEAGTLLGTFSTSDAYSATNASWTTKAGTQISPLAHPASQKIKLRLNALPKTGASPAADNRMLLDWCVVTISYTTPGTIGTGAYPALSAKRWIYNP